MAGVTFFFFIQWYQIIFFSTLKTSLSNHVIVNVNVVCGVSVAPMRGRGFRGSVQRGDMFRSRPPNTSRPPSLHVDDFVALETCGQQPTGPTGYNKISMRVAQVTPAKHMAHDVLVMCV